MSDDMQTPDDQAAIGASTGAGVFETSTSGEQPPMQRPEPGQQAGEQTDIPEDDIPF